MTSLPCIFIGHNYTGTYTITDKEKPPLDVLLICTRCGKEKDLTPYLLKIGLLKK